MTVQEMREKIINGLEHDLLDDDGYPNCSGCPYAPCSVRCQGDLVADALSLLKAQENEIKALRLLVDWAEECDFGLDNIRWREYVTKEELDKVEDYIEKMIYVARRVVEQG